MLIDIKNERFFVVSIIVTTIILTLSMFFSSGVNAPYGSKELIRSCDSPDQPVPEMVNCCWTDKYWKSIPCGYKINVDHPHFEATFLMLDGEDKSRYGGSVVLRRILFPVVAYPLMKVFGFLLGGVITSFLIHIVTFLIFISFIKKKIGTEAAIFSSWILSTYPGIPYYAGLPYSYASIFPGSLICFMLLWKISGITEIKKLPLYSFLLGLLFLAYDFLPIFGVAAVFILLLRKKYIWTIVLIPIMMLPNIISNLILKYVYKVDLVNSNSEMYNIIGLSYLGIIQPIFFKVFGVSPESELGMFLEKNAPFPDLSKWGHLLSELPLASIHTFLFSTFLFLPLLFLVLFVINLIWKREKMNVAVLSILIATALIFAFNNFAPPYVSWQMRGYAFARIYQPVFTALLVFSVIKMQQIFNEKVNWRKWIILTVCAVVIGNSIVSFGTIFNNSVSDELFHRFYILDFIKPEKN